MYGYCWESKWLELTHTEVPIARIAGWQPVRILHLSDLHWSPYDSLEFLEFAFRLGGSEKPDFVCLTGDLISVDNEYDFGQYLPTLKFLASLAPTYAVLGNHDGGVWSRERNGLADESIMESVLLESGIEVLHNRSVKIVVRHQKINLVGIPDLWAGGVNPEKAFARIDAEDSDITVVIAHNPDSKDCLSDFDWQLMLCGHTHGGQISLPLVGPPFVPVRDKRFIKGLKPWGERLIFVTRGVGSIYGARFYCRPEVSILDIV